MVYTIPTRPFAGASRLLLWACAAAGLSACLSPVHVRSARPLADGENEVSAGLSAAWAARSAATWETGTDTKFSKPASGQGLANLIPEVAYRRGLGGDVDVGVRAGGGAGLVSAEGAWRFHQRPLAAGTLHIGTGLQVSQWLASPVASGRAVLPLRASMDLAQVAGGQLSATAAVHAGWQWVQRPEVGATTPQQIIENTRWTLGNDGFTGGGGVLIDWRDDQWTLGLGCEADYWSGRIGAAGKEQTTYGVTAVQGVLSAGWRWGKDAAQLKKAADDLDSLTRPTQPPP